MDPKSISNLDPKLQETYARVMGTATPPTFSTENQQSATPPSDDGLSAPVGASSTPVTPTPMSENAFASSSPIPATTVSQTADGLGATPNPGPAASPFTTPTPQQAPQPLTPPAAMLPHETSTGLKVAYVIGAILFFAVYTVFWIKIFNLPFIF